MSTRGRPVVAVRPSAGLLGWWSAGLLVGANRQASTDLGSVFAVGFLDRAKKLRDQAKEAADQVMKLAEQTTAKASDALTDAVNRSATTPGGSPPPGGGAGAGASGAAAGGAAGGAAAGGAAAGGAAAGGTAAGGSGAPEYGTPYVAGMLGRPGWREQGLTDPAAILPIKERDRVGVPHTTKSQILEEPFGMGRRWSSGARSAALYYQLYPEHRAWEPPGGRAPLADVYGASAAILPDGRSLVFLAGGGHSVVLEVAGIDEPARAALARTVAERLTSV
jgi:hypothetical protein